MRNDGRVDSDATWTLGGYRTRLRAVSQRLHRFCSERQDASRDERVDVCHDHRAVGISHSLKLVDMYEGGVAQGGLRHMFGNVSERRVDSHSPT